MRARHLTAGTLAALALAAIGVTYVEGSSRAATLSEETCDGHGEDAPQKSKATSAHYEILPDVRLPTKVEDHIKLVAERYHKATGKSLVVTSGTRGAASQAEAIYEKIAAGDDVVKLYKNKSAVIELKEIFDEGKNDKDDRKDIIERMANAIRAQMKRGVFISAHLRSGAADIRSTDMTSADKNHFVESSESSGVNVMFEATPPHFHLQLE